MDDAMLLLRDEARLVFQHCLCHPDAPRVEAGLRIGGGAGDDAVEVVRESLCLDEGLPPAGRASVEVRARRVRAVEGGGDRLALHRHLVHRPICVINKLLGMAEREARVASRVSRVGGTGRIPGAKRSSHRAVCDRAGPPTVSNRLVFPVPSRRGQPHFNFDIGIGRRLDRCGHAAEGGQRGVRLSAVTGGRRGRRRECACDDRLRHGDGRIGQFQRRQTLARAGGRQCLG